MFRFGSSALTQARRGLHHVVFIEDHSIITNNSKRVQNLTQTLEKVQGKLQQDTCTVVRLNAGYLRQNDVVEFSKGGFNVEEAAKLKGNQGPCGLWGNIKKVLQNRDDSDVGILVLTNAADDCSRHPLTGMRGMEGLMRSLAEGRAGFRFSAWTVGLDVTRQHERHSIRDACNWTGGNALFLDCDGADNDGTTLTSAQAKTFFAAFNETDAAKLSATVKSNKKAFESNRKHDTILGDLPHTAPTF